MEKDIELTSEEKMELKKRGFIMKDKVLTTPVNFLNGVLSYAGFITTVTILIFIALIIISLPILFFFSGFFSTGNTLVSLIALFYFGLPIIFYAIYSIPLIDGILKYTVFKKILITAEYVLDEGSLVFTDKISNYISFSGWVDNDFMERDSTSNAKQLWIVLFILESVLSFGITLLCFLLSISLGLVIRYFAQIHNPLYAFGNIGQKIQSLTPRISEQSKMIQREFSSDMDFRVLSKSFDALARTFSDIISLVIRLEKVEKKVNQGNLFDSTKYIDSLREDIRVPLVALREYLNIQRTSLRASLDELSRVRVQVGGDSVLEGGKELQSMRGSELIQELDESIGRLDEMMERV